MHAAEVNIMNNKTTLLSLTVLITCTFLVCGCVGQGGEAVSASDCVGLSSELKETPLSLLKKNVEVSGYNDTQVDEILKVIQPYVKAIRGYQYREAHVSIEDLSFRTLLVKVNATTGEEPLDRDEYAFAISYYVPFGQPTIYENFTLVKYEHYYRLRKDLYRRDGNDIPNNLGRCALYLVSTSDKVAEFRESHMNQTNVSTRYGNQTNMSTSIDSISWTTADLLAAGSVSGFDAKMPNATNDMIIVQMSAVGGVTSCMYGGMGLCPHHFIIAFAVDPWSKEVSVFQPEEDNVPG
jgi:hypothetical protein